ncbi:MAG TPA: hypothetical protein VLG48_03990 [Candidatus Methylomirabilis sp.]|nr:hypothetical protein [Candidatus Methylomirabilis sp.]
MIPSSSGLDTLLVAVMTLGLGTALLALPATASFWLAYRNWRRPDNS